MGNGGFHNIYDNKDVYIFIDNGWNNIHHYHRYKIGAYPYLIPMVIYYLYGE